MFNDKDTIRRLGSALADHEQEKDEDVRSSTSGSSYPDVVPRSSSPASPAPEREPEAGGTGQRLPSPGNPQRQFLLGAVKEMLDERNSTRVAVDVATAPPAASGSTSRIAFYEFRHPADDTAAKLNRLSVQRLPSVTIATPDAAARRSSAAFSVHSPSLHLAPGEAGSIGGSDLDKEPDAASRPDIRPDDVARVVSDILAGQLELALDSFCALPLDGQREAKPTPASIAETDAQV